LKGYFPIRDIRAALNTCGVDADIASREIEHLVQGRCILSEDLRTSSLAEDDSIKLAPAGFVHLELLGNLNYLAAVAEDTWFAKSDMASVIAERIKIIADQFSETTVAHNARDLLFYLSAERDTRGTLTATMFQDGLYDRLTDLSDALEALEEQGRSNPWLFCVERYRPGSVFQATIANRTSHGIFAELEPGITGLVHRSRLPINYSNNQALTPGEKIEVKIVSVDRRKRRITLKFVRALPSG
jgi:hypothetical protein